MKNLTCKQVGFPSKGWIAFLGLFLLFAGCRKLPLPPVVHVTTVASGLKNPMGIETDRFGNLWVSEGETVSNDGKVWLIKPNGKKYLAIKNLAALVNPLSSEAQGTAHLLLDGNILYVLSGYYLYQIDISGYWPGGPTIDASKLPVEDVGGYMLQFYPDSHPYNLCKGPNGHIYIADAGANAIIHRQRPGKYSVLADIPGFKNPTPVGPSDIESVPTSVYYTGRDFLVTTLTGFPFPEGAAGVLRVARNGKITPFQAGLTTMVDLAEGSLGNYIGVHYGNFGPTGFMPSTGSLLWVNGSSAVPIVQALNMPVGIKKESHQTWYVTCMGDGTVKKVTYY